MSSNFTERSQVMTGARAIFSMNGAPVGFASGVDGSEEITYEPIDVLNNLMVQEHAPTGYRVTMNTTLFRVPTKSLRGQGIFPSLIQPANVLNAVPMEAMISDTVTSYVIAKAEGVKPQTSNFAFNARGVSSVNASFVAIRMLDESDISG